MRPSRLRARTALGAAIASVLAGLAALTPAQPGAAAIGREPAVTVVGPDAATLLDVIQLYADTSTLPVDPDMRISWDLDGDGSYETEDDGDGPVTTYARTPGTQDYSVQVLANGVLYVDDHEVMALKPQTTRLRLSPAYPRQGQKLTMTAGSRGATPVAHVWDVEGIKPRLTSSTVRGTTSARAALQTSSNLGSTIDVAGTGQDVTQGTTFGATIPVSDGFDARSIKVKSTALMPDGTRLTTLRDVQTNDTTAKGFATKALDPDFLFDCDDLPSNGPAAPCAAMTHSNPRAQFPMMFDDTTPSITWCHPANEKWLTSNTTAKEQAAEIGSGPAFWGSLTAARGRSVGGTPEVTTSRRNGLDCVTAQPQTVSWNFGDQTGTFLATSDAPVAHTFAEPGTYQVTLVSRVPYVRSVDGVVTAKPRFMKVQKRVTLVVPSAEHCGFLSFGGLRAYTMAHGVDPRQLPAASIAPYSCFDKLKATDGHTYFRTRPGWGLWLAQGTPSSLANAANEQVEVYGTNGGTQAVPLTLDQTTQTVTPLAGQLIGRWAPPGEPLAKVLSVPVLKIPAADADGKRVFPVMSSQFTEPTLKGLTVTSVGLVMRNAAVPYVKVTLKAPPPMGGTTPVAYRSQYPDTIPEAIEGTPVSARGGGGYPPGVDFRLDLSGMSVNGLGIQSGWLEHHTDGDVWRAEFVADFAGVKVKAPFMADPGGTQPSTCETPVGPSGLQITNGQFDFAGVSLTMNPGPQVGPFAVNCMAANIKTAPFMFRGALAGTVLNADPIRYNACFAFAYLATGQTGNQCGGDYVAPENGVFWSRVSGQLSLLGYFPFNGWVDSAFGSGEKQVRVGGDATWSKESAAIDIAVTLSVKGGMRFNTGEFSFMGKVNGCLDWAGPGSWCGDVASGGITNRGGGACAGPAGAVYLTPGGFDWFVLSCDLTRDIAVAGLRTARSERATSVPIKVEPDQGVVTFLARSDTSAAGAAPRAPMVRLTSPTGRVIDATVGSSTRTELVVMNHEAGETYIRVPSPAAGTWKVAQAGDVALEDVELYTPAGPPVVDAEVVGRGQTRTLQFDTKRLAPSDRITFTEQSPGRERVLGTRTRAGADVTIPAAGLRGTRSVYAIIERRGIPIKKLLVDTYTAPGVPDLAPVPGVTATAAGQALTATWKAVPGAQRYRVSLVTDDGRRMRTYTSGLTTTFPEVTRYTGGRLTVVALAGPARDSSSRGDALNPVRAVTLRL